METESGRGVAAWCEELAILSSMQDFPDLSCSQLHSDADLQDVCEVFSRFSGVLQLQVLTPLCSSALLDHNKP